jgi:hypothetical protein
LLLLTLLGTLVNADASSHREAPAISMDPSADLTDFYAFVSPEDASKAVFILNVNPLSPPGGGPNFHRFDDNVLYQIHIDNEGDAEEDITFGFLFETSYQYPEEFLYNLGDISNPANINHTQTVSFARWDDGVPTLLGRDITTAPTHVGVLSDATGAYQPLSATPGSLTTTHTYDDGTYRLFAGPRQDGFFVDLERTFDLLNLAGTDNQNTLLGYNVSTIAIEVPIAMLTKDGLPASSSAQNEIIGSWATTSRKTRRTLNTDGTADFSGGFTQVARLGSPLVNEVVLPVSQKDLFNAAHPRDDGQFLSYVTNPILPIYMEALLGIPNPMAHDEGLGFGGREDLVLAFLTGHPATATQPGGFALGGAIPGEPGKVFAAYEALRLNLSVPTSGFPNGRTVQDDIVDTALSAMAGLLIDGSTATDGVDASGLHFLDGFPFLGDPWAGDAHPEGTHP